MTTISKSKVMKAAWTIWRKQDASNWSESLKKAWAWAKKTATKGMIEICGLTAKVWNADNFSRLYFSDNSYIQINKSERKPYGYYERHRACKGETFTTTWAKAVGQLANSIFGEYIEMTGFQISKF